jgi:hypothetical protein
MDDQITIIEGPTPQFMHVDEDWARGIFEGPSRYKYSFTNLRTFNGPALIERCYRAWHSKGMMYLEYRDEMGLTLKTPILAARAVESEDGQVLQLWLRMDDTEEAELNLSDDEGM